MANVGNHLIYKDVDNNVWEPGVYGWTEEIASLKNNTVRLYEKLHM